MTENKKIDPAKNAKNIRRARARRMAVRFSSWVLLPTAVAAVYFVLIASDMYESQSLVTVQSAEGSSLTGIESLIGIVPGAGSSRDALAIRDFILSRDMLLELEEKHGFLDHYKNPKADPLSRLEKDATNEEAYDYYLDQVDVTYDSQSGVLTLAVRAFTAKKARAFAEAIVQSSERKVNELSRRAREDRMRFAKSEVEEAEKRLTDARKGVLELQEQGSEFNPLESAGHRLTIRAELEAELAKTQAELSQNRAFMAPNAPKVISLQQKAASLRRQVKKESERLVGAHESGLNASIAEFEGVMMEKEFAERRLLAAQSAFEVASMEAARQHRYLAIIASPSAPDEATHPKRLLSLLTVFIIAFFSFGIGTLLVASVREHAKL